MKVFVPHKDTLLQLAKAQRAYIDAYNSQAEAGGFLLPRYPLWAFAEELPEAVTGCTIHAPQADGSSAVFPVELEAAGSSMQLHIVFAELEGGSSGCCGLPGMQDFPAGGAGNQFPLRPRTFRTGTVVLQDNGWQLFDERWHKTKQLST